MPGIDESITFRPINIAILTVSDSRSPDDDKSGNILVERLTKAGHQLAGRAIVKDEVPAIIEQLNVWISDPAVEAVISTGGTGVTGRDVTPEAFAQVYEKEIAGFGEIFRQISFKLIGTSTIQSRATAGVAGGTYLFALPLTFALPFFFGEPGIWYGGIVAEVLVLVLTVTVLRRRARRSGNPWGLFHPVS